MNSLILLIVTLATVLPCYAEGKMNVLFLVSDDMRPEIGAYKGKDYPTPFHPNMHTPNLDALASRSLLLKKAYVQQAVCSPSRTSLLTGRRIDTTHVYDLLHYWRKVAGNFTTIPQYFKENGYITAGMGKIFHPGIASDDNDPISWTEPYFLPKDPWSNGNSWRAVDDKEIIAKPMQDQQTATRAVSTLTKLAPKGKTGEQPFFVAVGFHKPHLPWVFPKSFLDYYPEEDIRLPANPYVPSDMPDIAWQNFHELRDYKDIGRKYGAGQENMTLPDDKVKELRRAYYAALSYTDSLVGEVVAALDKLGLADNTIISFWGDHGWQLGEHSEWCKQTNFEIATHAPMMVRVPGLTDSGVVTERMTEFVDLFPTLAEAAGLPQIPLCARGAESVTTCTEGVSMVPLMKNPEAPWKAAAFSQYPRMAIDGNMVMGYSIRTEQFRYTIWTMYDHTEYKPFSFNRNAHGAELYDHDIDPEENVNRVNFPKYKEQVAKLHKKVAQGWRDALPPSMIERENQGRLMFHSLKGDNDL